MTQLYLLLGITKQAHWKYIQRQNELEERKTLLIRAMLHVRQIHPKLGARKMFKIIQPDFVGRDAFIELYNASGLRLQRERSHRRTTFSNPSAKYSNLTVNMIFTDINQIWTSDITYLAIGADTFLYITFIMDVYSRRVLGFNVSDSLSAQSCVKALKMALKTRNIKFYDDLIHHSDKGTQYTSNIYTALLSKHQIKISMCNSVYENTHIERVNGTFKNDYLISLNIKSLAECQRALKKIVPLYNNQRPHWSLGGSTPFDFEMSLKAIPLSQRIRLQIYHDKNHYNCQNNRQLKFDF